MEQKEFDLRKALTGYPVKTRDGHKAMITGLSIHKTYPLLGVVISNMEIIKHTWTIDGKWTEYESDMDLFME